MMPALNGNPALVTCASPGIGRASALLSQAAGEPHRPGSCIPRDTAPYQLSQRASFWVAAGVVAHTLWTSAAPAMTYPLFAEQWHLTHTVTTAVFAIYPVVVAAVLVGFGEIGRAS